jgi:hypothetical protein
VVTLDSNLRSGGERIRKNVLSNVDPVAFVATEDEERVIAVDQFGMGHHGQEVLFQAENAQGTLRSRLPELNEIFGRTSRIVLVYPRASLLRR